MTNSQEQTTPFTLSEELLLLALDPERGKVSANRQFLRWGLAAAVLIELEGRGRVAEERRRIVVTRADPTGVPLLDDALGALRDRTHRRTRTKPWLERYGHRAEHLALASLVARGAVRTEVRRALGIFRVERHQVLAREWRARRLTAFLNRGEFRPDDRGSRALAALLKATKLAPRIGVPRDMRKEMRPLLRDFWQAEAVRKKVASAQSSAGGGGGGGDGGGGGGGG